MRHNSVWFYYIQGKFNLLWQCHLSTLKDYSLLSLLNQFQCDADVSNTTEIGKVVQMQQFIVSVDPTQKNPCHMFLNFGDAFRNGVLNM